MIESIFATLKSCALEIDTLLKNPSTDYLSSQNSSGDTQLKVDVEADKLIEKALLALACVKGVCSEEKNQAVFKGQDSKDSKQRDRIQDSYQPKNAEYARETKWSGGEAEFTSAQTIQSEGIYIIAYDPLDGSSLIDSNLSVGSIFGIYKDSLESKNLVAAAYVLYGPRLEIVLAQKEVEHFRYCGNAWEKIGNLRLGKKGKINAPGGTQANWESKHKQMVDSLFSQGYRLRYSGGMVPDLHQILIKGGGLFSYPATSDAKEGKLRKLFEVFPFAFIYERAGGVASNGKVRLLELECAHIHDTTPCFFGSSEEMALVAKTYQN
ncbi:MULTISPECIES: class 1 fructose-bisphosphatase [unclassified Helicobacter]|uniref:class 1 fructose-bisphosphatase n=1 Tax=unclassified Helicobacter TaxID=2593540 RepID=UPI0021633791|nr:MULTISPECIES: class 1 fructose-bisphosphatase [unclassified Helicobacter]